MGDQIPRKQWDQVAGGHLQEELPFRRPRRAGKKETSLAFNTKRELKEEKKSPQSLNTGILVKRQIREKTGQRGEDSGFIGRLKVAKGKHRARFLNAVWTIQRKEAGPPVGVIKKDSVREGTSPFPAISETRRVPGEGRPLIKKLARRSHEKPSPVIARKNQQVEGDNPGKVGLHRFIKESNNLHGERNQKMLGSLTLLSQKCAVWRVELPAGKL